MKGEGRPTCPAAGEDAEDRGPGAVGRGQEKPHSASLSAERQASTSGQVVFPPAQFLKLPMLVASLDTYHKRPGEQNGNTNHSKQRGRSAQLGCKVN